MANPTWFDESTYITNKLAQLKAVDPSVAWNESTLKVAIANAGYTVFEHFETFGAAEHVSPNAQFNVAEYLAAKAAQMNASLKDGETPWTEASIAKAIKDAGMTEWSHYQMFGSKEGVNPSNAFDSKAYLTAKAAAMTAAGEKQADGSEWTADAVKDAIHNAGMSVFEHYTTFAGKAANEVAAGSSYPVAAGSKVEPSITFDPYQPANVGSSFELTAEDNTFAGTANSDTITGKLEHLSGKDSIIDTNANDQDHMILDAGMTDVTVPAGVTVKGIENITVNTAAVRDLTVHAAGFEGMQTLRVKPTADTFANLTVDGLTKATVDAATASSVALTGGAAADDAVVLKLNNAAVAVTNNNIETLTISSDVATTVTLTDAATAAVKTAGNGDMVLKMGVADAVSTHSVTKGNTGKLAVEFTGSATAIDTTKVTGADSITLTGGTNSAVTANNGQNFVLKANEATFNMVGTNTATNDSVTVNLVDSANDYAIKTGDKLENITINAAKGNTITALSGGAVANTATVTGSDKLTLGAVTGFKTLDASAFTGTLNGTAALDNLSILGGTGTNTVTLAASAVANTTLYKGVAEGVDNLTIGSAAVSGSIIAKTGAGVDTVILAGKTEISKVVSLDLGAGDDKLDIGSTGSAAKVSGDLIAKAGEGKDTLTVTALDVIGSAANATLDAGAGDDTIVLTTLHVGSDANAGTLTVNGGEGNDSITLTTVTMGSLGKLTIDGGAGDDTITLAATATASAASIGYTVNGGEGNDTVVLGAANYAGVTFSGIETFKLGGAATLSAKAFAEGVAVVKPAGVATATLAVNAEATGADVINLSNVAKGIDTTINIAKDDTFTTLTGSQNKDTLAIVSEAGSGVTLDLSKAAVSGIEAITFGSLAVDKLTIGNFTGTDTLSVTFDSAQTTSGDSLTIDLAAAFNSVALDKIAKAGDFNVTTVSGNAATLTYMDDNSHVVTVALAGVAASDGIVGTTGDLVITGAHA